MSSHFTTNLVSKFQRVSSTGVFIYLFGTLKHHHERIGVKRDHLSIASEWMDQSSLRVRSCGPHDSSLGFDYGHGNLVTLSNLTCISLQS